MSANAPERMLDPICDMVVEVAEARANDRIVDYRERTYAFCSDSALQGGTVMVNNAKVIKTDELASNGVIHVIDAVLLPKM